MLQFDSTYRQLPENFYSEVSPAQVPKPTLVLFNQLLADELGLDFSNLSDDVKTSLFSGNRQMGHKKPIAQAYAGHQFGHFTMLGDGRALLLGEHATPGGQLVDIQLKGSGRTPYSRGGDGKATLGPMLREYIMSEALHALGIPTTRSLAVVTTGEGVQREQVLPGAVLTRVASSHIRVGTFQYAAAFGNTEYLKALADYAIQRHYPEVVDTESPYLEFLSAVASKQAELIAKWQCVGFIHGVMNTDNMTISGETIDYGPCAFMDEYHPATVFSSIDRQGRYAYQNQSTIAQWNLARLAESLLPLINDDHTMAIDQATAIIERFPSQYDTYWLNGMGAKLGLLTIEDGDKQLVNGLLPLMATQKADFTNTFCQLAEKQLVNGLLPLMATQKADFTNTFCQLAEKQLPEVPLFTTEAFQSWHQQWQGRINQQGDSWEVISKRMRAVNPVVIPRNHQVEKALAAAVEDNDLGPTQQLLAALAAPYDDTPDKEPYKAPPKPSERVTQTFCGT